MKYIGPSNMCGLRRDAAGNIVGVIGVGQVNRNSNNIDEKSVTLLSGSFKASVGCHWNYTHFFESQRIILV